MKFFLLIYLFFSSFKLAAAQTEADFMRSIRDDPEDDLKRLVFADWLEENHQEIRAIYIRLEIEQAKLAIDSPRAIEITREKAGLIEDFIKFFPGIDSTLYTFNGNYSSALPLYMSDRGFLTVISTSGRWPIVQKALMCDSSPILGLNCDSHAIENVQQLSRIIHVEAPAGQVRYLTNLTHMQSIHARARGTVDTAIFWNAVAAGTFPRLTEIEFRIQHWEGDVVTGRLETWLNLFNSHSNFLLKIKKLTVWLQWVDPTLARDLVRILESSPYLRNVENNPFALRPDLMTDETWRTRPSRDVDISPCGSTFGNH